MIEYHNHTVIEVRKWVESGSEDDILDNAVSRIRANALVHCPYVKDNDVLVVSATDGDTVIGYTAIFPEKLERPDMWIATGTTLWVNPDYADEFVGYNLVQRLWQSYPDCSVIGSNVAYPASMIDKLLGAMVVKYVRKAFVLRRTIEVHSFRNFLSLLIEPIRRCRQKKYINCLMTSHPTDIRVLANDTINEEAYSFIRIHGASDTFLRSREMLNWIIRYPLGLENPLLMHIGKHIDFSSQCSCFRSNLLYIYKERTLIGITLLSLRESDMHVHMLYTDEIYKNQVYALICKAAWLSNANLIYSMYKDLNTYIEASKCSLHMYDRDILFTYPKKMNISNSLVLQGMDGDMFA